MSLLRRLRLRGRRGSGTASPPSPATGPSVAAAGTAEVRRAAAADSDAGRHADAVARVAAALAEAPDDPVLRLAQAAALHAGGRFREAYVAARRAVAAGAPSTREHALLGRIAFDAGDYAAGEAWFRGAVVHDPHAADAHAGHAESLHAQGRLDEAIAAYRRALDVDPTGYDALVGLGNALRDRGDPAGAEQAFRRAIAANAERAIGWRYLGVVCDDAHREAEAIAAHERAVAVEVRHGQNDGAFLGLAASLRDAGRFADALAVLEPNLQRLPGADAQLLYGHLLLALGRLPEGWHHSEFRFLTPHFLARRQRFARPVWAGQDLAGRTLLLRAEQGIGDTLQFARYAALVKALGATVHLAVPAELAGLAGRITGVDRVLVLHRDEAGSAFDYHVPLLSLPRVFGTSLASIPAAVPYVRPDPERVARWRSRLAGDGATLRVGLVWGGNPLNAEDRFRSLPLAALAPLGGIPGVRWYALQKGPREREGDAPPPGLDLVNLGPELADFDDTAAVVAELDLVVSVCTSVAHLAGALGRPLWVLLHRAADWRWLTERSDCPWYPSAALFRQARRGEWTDVVERVRAALATRVGDPRRDDAAARPDTRVALPACTRPADAPGFRPGCTAVAETRVGIMEHFPDDDGEGASLAWYGEWLQPQIDRLAGLVEPGATVLEAGAGVGAHSLALAAAVGASGHVIAYEPRAVHRRILRLNLAANGVGWATVMRRRLGAAAAADTESLDDLWLERLDWFVAHAGVDASDVLDGAGGSLWRLRPRLHVGARAAVDLAPWALRLRDFGYRCWRGETPLFRHANFNRRTEDIFAGRRAFALIAIPEERDDDLAPTGCEALS